MYYHNFKTNRKKRDVTFVKTSQENCEGFTGVETPGVDKKEDQEEIPGVKMLEEEYCGTEIPGVYQDIETPGVSNLTE